MSVRQRSGRSPISGGVDMQELTAIFAGGAWRPPHTTAVIDVHNPATERVIARVPAGDGEDIDAAVAAARSAAAGLAEASAKTRAGYLAAIRDGLADRREEMAATITAEMGAPISLSRRLQTELPITVLDSYVQLLQADQPLERIDGSVVIRRPAGVVGAITPWNYPLHQSVAKIAAALAAGCPVVHKPSELAPLSAYRFAQIVANADLPPGAYNLVCGTGDQAGAALAGHAGVDLISFTGSTRAGRLVATAAAANLTRLNLELGGKSANLILADADLAAAVKVGVANCLLNAGQTCTAWSRMLVPRPRHDEAVALAVASASKYRPGDPTDPATRLGPLVSSAQRERVAGYVQTGRGEARLVLDGTDPAQLPSPGWYLGPCIFAEVPPQAVIAQQEIFGPVLSIIAYDGEDDAVRIANGTGYGLAAGVWSGDPEHAMAVARRLRAGQVDINGAPFNPRAPFGGFGESGYGRELGPHGLVEFCGLTSIQLPP
jgi:aldehyde dehydrogenase (NAD+)